MGFTFTDSFYIGQCLQGLLFGLYSGSFVMYLQCLTSQKGADKEKTFLFYALCMLYVLSVITISLDIALVLDPGNIGVVTKLYRLDVTAFGFSDFIAQSILIYRCWIVWHRNIHVVIIPSISAFTFLAIWIVSDGSDPGPLSTSTIIEQSPGDPIATNWGHILNVTGLAMSMTLNALVTGLIVFRIFKVFWEVKATADDRNLGGSGRSTLRRVIFVIIESGMALFSIQLVRLVVTVLWRHSTGASDILAFFFGTHQMLNGITPTIILVRVSMGFSFHDENSMVEASIGSLHFGPDDPTPISETSSINSIVDQERRDDSGVQLHDDTDGIEIMNPENRS